MVPTSPNNVEEYEDTKILWNFPIRTDHEIRHHKPDIIVVDKRSQTAVIMTLPFQTTTTLFENVLTRSERTPTLATQSKRYGISAKLILLL